MIVLNRPEKKLIGNIKVDQDKKHKILLVGAEVSPYASVGGFASVLAYLSRALLKMGHDVRIFIPKFGFIEEEK